MSPCQCTLTYDSGLFCADLNTEKEGKQGVLEAVLLLLNELGKEELTKVHSKVTELLK